MGQIKKVSGQDPTQSVQEFEYWTKWWDGLSDPQGQRTARQVITAVLGSNSQNAASLAAIRLDVGPKAAKSAARLAQFREYDHFAFVLLMLYFGISMSMTAEACQEGGQS